jgi:hypothetical protein
MFRRNCGTLDRVVRLLLGAILLPTGLFLLDGLQGDLSGVAAAILGLLWLVTGASGFCIFYVPFGISTVSKSKVWEERLHHEA